MLSVVAAIAIMKLCFGLCLLILQAEAFFQSSFPSTLTCVPSNSIRTTTAIFVRLTRSEVGESIKATGSELQVKKTFLLKSLLLQRKEDHIDGGLQIGPAATPTIVQKNLSPVEEKKSSSAKSYDKFLKEKTKAVAQKQVKEILRQKQNPTSSKEINIKANTANAAANRKNLDQFKNDNYRGSSSSANKKAPSIDRRHGRDGSQAALTSKRRPPVRDSLEALSFAKTVLIDPDIKANVDDMRFSPETKLVLKREKGFELMTPVQTQSYDLVFSGVDVVARSKTGTGKTLAFGLPLIEKVISTRKVSGKGGSVPSILILEPTRELVIQVAQELSVICKVHGVKVTTIYGGVSFDDQVKILERGVDIIVATPGRALDHVTRESLNLGTIQHVVLDEGDIMLEMGFQKHVETLLANVVYPGLQARRAAKKSLSEDDADNDTFDDSSIVKDAAGNKRQVQMLLFSATMAGWICKLTAKHMETPVFLDAVSAGETRLPSTISHIALRFPEKRNLRAVIAGVQDAIVTQSLGGKTIVFTNTKVEADSIVVSPLLSGFRPQALHGGMSQGARQATIRQFKEGKIELLIATDVASRGLDVDGVDLVIHSQPPDDMDTYVHRSGRTGRAGKAGVTVILHSQSVKEVTKLNEFERGAKFQFLRIASSSPDSLIAATKSFSSRKLEFQASEAIRKRGVAESKLIAAKTQMKASVVVAPSARKVDVAIAKKNRDVVKVGNWASGDVTEDLLDENRFLRDLYESEKLSGVKTDMTEEQRERAMLLVERSERKKARRQEVSRQLKETHLAGDEVKE